MTDRECSNSFQEQTFCLVVGDFVWRWPKHRYYYSRFANFCPEKISLWKYGNLQRFDFLQSARSLLVGGGSRTVVNIRVFPFQSPKSDHFKPPFISHFCGIFALLLLTKELPKIWNRKPESSPKSSLNFWIWSGLGILISWLWSSYPTLVQRRSLQFRMEHFWFLKSAVDRSDHPLNILDDNSDFDHAKWKRSTRNWPQF